MYEYYRGKLIAARPEEARRYSEEIERFYQEARCKSLDDVKRIAQSYVNQSFFIRICLKMGLFREPPQAVGYKIRLEELLKESA